MAKNIIQKSLDAASAVLGLSEAPAPEEEGAAPDAVTKQVEAFCLRDCNYGEAGEVVLLDASDAKLGEDHGMLDLNPAAIAAAKKK